MKDKGTAGKSVRVIISDEEKSMIDCWRKLREEDQKLVSMLMDLLIRPKKE